MSNTAFQTVSTNKLASQIVTSGKIYARSTSVSDTANLTIYGEISATPDSEVVALNGKVEVSTTADFDSISQSILSAGEAGTVSAYTYGTAATGDVTILTNPADGDTLTLGGKVYRFKTTMAAINDVQRGGSASATALSLKRAINLDGTPGVDYYAGTAANAIFSATVATTVISLTDRIACNRLVPYSITESATNFAIRVPIGGVDGTLLFSFAPSVTTAANVLTFSTEDHSTTTLPALMLGTSSPVNVQGNPAMLRLWSDNSIDYKIQSSTDQINWHDTSEGTDTLSASTMTYVTLAELADFIRFVIVTNANTGDTIADFRVIY